MQADNDMVVEVKSTQGFIQREEEADAFSVIEKYGGKHTLKLFSLSS